MKVDKEEILRIADLAKIELKEDEIEKYIENLQEILDFANIVNTAQIDGLNITVGTNEAKNIFREDEVINFEDKEALMQNAPSQSQNMFKIPKVIQ